MGLRSKWRRETSQRPKDSLIGLQVCGWRTVGRDWSQGENRLEKKIGLNLGRCEGVGL